MNHASIELLKDVYYYDISQVTSHLGILYVHPDYQREDVIQQLQQEYSDYEFMEIGKSTNKIVSEVLQQANIILAVFSLHLAILAALF